MQSPYPTLALSARHGSACTLIAAKLVEIAPPSVDDYVYISDKTYSRQEVVDMEATVCAALRFRLHVATPHRFLDRFLRASRASAAGSAGGALLPCLVRYLLDLAVLEYRLVPCAPPRLVAAAAVYLARATLGVAEAPPGPQSAPAREGRHYWSATLAHYTGHGLPDLEGPVRLLRRLQEGAGDGPHVSSIFNKHRGSQCLKVALKTAVREEDLGFA